MNKNILIIDDDKEIVELLAVYLRNEGYNIYKAYDGDEALQKVSTYEVDLYDFGYYDAKTKRIRSLSGSA